MAQATRYFIEQEPTRFYDRSELNNAQNRALRLRDRSRPCDGVMLIAEEPDEATGEYQWVGTKGFFYGLQSFTGSIDAFVSGR